jgi:FdhD protein
MVAVEEPMEVRVNGAPFAVIMRTPGADRELAAGFLLAEDVIHGSEELGTIEYCADMAEDDEGRDNTLNVTVIGGATERLATRLGERRQVMMTASCGLCGRRTIESLRARVPSVQGDWKVAPDVVRSLPPILRQAQHVFETTGGLHAAGLFDLDGKLQMFAEDVGRHNAVDKVIGRQLLRDALPLDRTMMVVSGRTSFELVQKALQLATEAGITLCGFVRGETFNIYAHAERIA